MSTSTEMREYIVSTRKFEDNESLYADMENAGGPATVPQRVVKCLMRRITSRNTHYLITDQEAELLRSDSRVLGVTLTAEQLGYITAHGSSFTENGNWNKSIVNTTTDRNWGLYRCAQGFQTPGWGGDSNPSIIANVTVNSQTGQNVDVVIVDGHIDPNHPEFAVNSDGSGGSRVVQFNWFQYIPNVTGHRPGTYQYGPYTVAKGATTQAEADNNHGTHVAGIACGNTQGWARDSNIYNLNPYGSNPNFDYVTLSADNFLEYIRVWHLSKTSGNPTICNNSYGKYAVVPITSIVSANYQGNTLTAPAGGWSSATFLQYGIYNDGTNAFIPVRYLPEDVEVQDCIDNGIIFIGIAHNQSTLILNDTSDPNWNNSVTDSSGQTYYIFQGSSPGAAYNSICVGNVDNRSTEIKRYDSNCGPRVDVYAPGTYITSSLLTAGAGLQAEGWPAGIRDPRNINYFMGKYGGTSMAAPQVTGIIACLLQTYPYVAQQDVINYLTQYGTINQLTENYFPGSSYDTSNLQGSPNRYLYATFGVVSPVLSSDATLSSLYISNTTLTPTFNGATTSYTVTYPYSTTSMVVTPTVNESHATITVNGVAVTSGTPSGAIGLAVGSNTISIVVTAQDGVTTQTYTITATRSQQVLSSDNTLSALTINNGTLTPAFNKTIISYTASVGNSVSTLNVTPTTSDSTAVVSVNGTPGSSATAFPVSLNVGANTILILVTAANGATKTYSLIVTRAAPVSSDATLSGLSISQGTLSPSFNSNTVSYSVSVNSTVPSMTVSPVVNESHATLTVNGVAALSGSATLITLNSGNNTITIVVTAQDGVTTKTYTINVTKTTVAITVTAQNGKSQTYTITLTKGSPTVSSDATLSSLVPSTGSLSPTFSSGTTSYTMSVSAGVASIAFTPTANESHATITVNGTTVSSGNQSGYITLASGSNTIQIAVTAQDGTTIRTYSVVITKAAIVLSNDATLSLLTFNSGTLDNNFTSTNTLYTLTISSGTNSITLTPTVHRYGATIVMSIGSVQSTLTSGVASGSISTPVGSTVIALTVTAPDTVTTKIYTITVSRAAGIGYGTRLNLSYGSDPTQFVNVYVPNQNPLGTIMYIHGGAWHSGDGINYGPSSTSERAQFIPIVQAGYAIIDVNYRDLSNGGGITAGTSGILPGDVADTAQALLYCLSPQQFGSSIDPYWQLIYNYIAGISPGSPGNGLMVFGTSAGGHLTYMAACEVGTRLYNSTGSWPSLLKGVGSMSGPMNLDYLPANYHNGTNTPYNFLDSKYLVSNIIDLYIQSGNESDLQLASPFYRYGSPDGADLPPQGPWYTAVNSSNCKFYFIQNENDTLVPLSNVAPMAVAMSTHNPSHTFIERVQEGPLKADWDGFSNVNFYGTLTSTTLLPSTGQTLGDAYDVIGSGTWVYNNGNYLGSPASSPPYPASVNGFTLWFQHNYTTPENTKIMEYANRTFGKITFSGGNLDHWVTLTTSTTGLSYSTTISVSGGASPYTYTLMSGAVPQGITLNGSTGVLSGTPTVPGLYSFKILATDSNGAVATQIYSLTIKSASPVVYNKPALVTGYDGTFSGARYPRDIVMHTQYAPGVSGSYDPFGSVDSNAKSTAFDYSATQVYVVDEIQWTNGGAIIKPTGDDLQALADYWRYHGVSPGGSITPAAELGYGGFTPIPTATVLADAIKLDWLSVDPYIFQGALPQFNNDITQTINGLIAWTQGWINRLAPYNIPVYLIPQGIASQVGADLTGIANYLSTQYQTFTSRQIAGRVVFPYRVLEGTDRYTFINVDTTAYTTAYPLLKTNQKYPKISGGRPGSGQTYPRFKNR